MLVLHVCYGYVFDALQLHFKQVHIVGLCFFLTQACIGPLHSVIAVGPATAHAASSADRLLEGDAVASAGLVHRALLVGAHSHLVRVRVKRGEGLVLVEAQYDLVLDLLRLGLTENAEYLVLAVGFLDDCAE